MSGYSNLFGQAAEHHMDGSITNTFAKMAGHDVGPAASVEQTASIDPGFDIPTNG